MSPIEIFEYKNKWKQGYTVSVHSDLDWQCKSWCRKFLERHQWSMTQYTDVYEHTFHFEVEEKAQEFKQSFIEWVNEKAE